MPSIDWNKRVTLIDFQKAESQEPVRDYEFKNRLLQAIGVSDDDWELEWSYIKYYLNSKQYLIIKYSLMGYKLKDIKKFMFAGWGSVWLSDISRERQKAYRVIKDIYK